MRPPPDGSVPKVAVLLSTYNGERFLREQLDSLVAQVGVEPHLFVRDDGSSDRTVDMLQSYAGRWPWLAEVAPQPNLGAARSFFRLLAEAPEGYDYYAFCDQDDVWLPHKLARAAARLAGRAGPALYCSQFTCADAALNVIGPGPGDGDARFEHLLFENIAWGCTIVMNAAARALVAPEPPRHPRAMHDWWSAIVVSALGEVIYDPEPGLLYRQHGANEVGLKSGRANEVLGHARRFLKDPAGFYPLHAQASELLRLFSSRLAPRQVRLLGDLVGSKRSLPGRLRYGFFGPIDRRRASDALVARALVLGGWY